MINDFNDGTVAWTDWNILLDEQGGPNHVGNFCFAPVHADLKKGRADFYKLLLLYRAFFKIYPAGRQGGLSVHPTGIIYRRQLFKMQTERLLLLL
ncbi:MAG: hypothetical protein WDM78_04710 [Puia sp.]